MHYGLVLPLSGIDGTIEKLVDYAHIAEEEGWEGIFLEDYSIYWGDNGHTYDPWLALTAIALRTRHLRLGITVIPLPDRLPWQIARAAVTLDYLSQGRLILGFGLGDAQNQPFLRTREPRLRGRLLDEGLEVLAGLLSAQPFSYHGQCYQAEEVTFRPGPLQQPRIPLWIGGFWPRKAPALRAARWDGFVPARLAEEGSDGMLTPGDVRAIKDFISAHRSSTAPFDLMAGGYSPGADRAAARARVEAFAEAGATWWAEFVLPEPTTGPGGTTMLQRIKQGPPR
jgi:alkanesulfonate monooxygenase SsuD/methylene tetrahydromethanopterin reductase-like flavin-dependent oxidoreductase (luciferase family)